MPGIVGAFTQSHASNWVPLTWISLMVDCQLYGLGAGGYHLTNVLLHAAYGHVVVCRPLPDDRPRVAQRAGGSTVRDPSLAGGIGGLGHRAERRPQRPVLHADAGGVCGLCASPAFACTIPGGDGFLCPRAAVQGDVGDAAAAAALAGLLAARAVCRDCAPSPNAPRRNGGGAVGGDELHFLASHPPHAFRFPGGW